MGTGRAVTRGRWRAPPEPTGPLGTGLLVVLGAVVVGLNLLVNLLLDGHRFLVPLFLAGAVGLVLLAHGQGLSWDELGLARDRLGPGVLQGLVAALVISLVVTTVAALPPLRATFGAPGTPSGGGALAWAVLVQIPFGVALPEELIFRSVLFGALRRSMVPWVSAIWTSAAFGLWHVLPTLDPTSPVSGGARTVTGVVVATAIAGVGLVWLRVRAGSIAAPFLAHSAINGAALLAAAAR